MNIRIGRRMLLRFWSSAAVALVVGPLAMHDVWAGNGSQGRGGEVSKEVAPEQVLRGLLETGPLVNGKRVLLSGRVDQWMKGIGPVESLSPTKARQIGQALRKYAPHMETLRWKWDYESLAGQLLGKANADKALRAMVRTAPLDRRSAIATPFKRVSPKQIDSWLANHFPEMFGTQYHAEGIRLGMVENALNGISSRVSPRTREHIQKRLQTLTYAVRNDYLRRANGNYHVGVHSPFDNPNLSGFYSTVSAAAKPRPRGQRP